ncbi:MAG: amino acid ABC transporter permease [Gammaproteobacteria bacterium]|nr:amino acid ABC transporter permease [Gammaproteobacteria bacterium]
MQFDFAYTWDALPRLLEGAWVTLQVSAFSFAASLVLATLLTVLRNAWPNRALELLLAVYVSFVRGTPVLVQIFLIYYVLPVVGIDLGPVTAGIAAITLNSAAYTLEIFRGGLCSIPAGQYEAARSLGLGTTALWLRVVLPQLFIKSIPPLVNEFTLVAKMTPLLATITVVELMRVSQQIFSSNFRPVEVLTGAFLIYFVMLFTVSRLSVLLERRLETRQA